ncbi:MAG TPA: peroxiredoxin family protein [Opitutaceae bacterium]
MPALLAAGLLLATRLVFAQTAAMTDPKGGMTEPAKSDMKPMMADKPMMSDAKMEKPMMSAPMAMMTPGLQVGAKAPDFVLKDASGKDVSLQGLLAKGKVALAFYRSADWCPYCMAQMKDLQANLARIQGAGVQLVGISYDSPDTLTRVMGKHGLTFPLLSDAGSKTIDAYGIRNQEAKGRAVGVAHPVLFILDQQGVVRAKLMRDNYKERPEVDEIVATAKSIM